MPKISKIEPKIPILPKRMRVAAYARVSRTTDRLMHSAAAQISYYNELIQQNPEWIFAGVYADMGISGLSTNGRDEFSRLIADCDAGKIDIVLCKSISRFARNTVDLLKTIRHLKELGVEVRFEKEHINSLSEDGELLLTLLASFSQEESRSISENVKWGVRKRMQSGEIGIANKHILGYRYNEELQQYVIIPEEAETVRRMFQMYLDGVSLRMIADNMNNAGFRSTLGNPFKEGTVRQLIFNEIYAGDLIRQKCYMENPITKHKVLNRGELPQYLYTDCHEAIIDRETYTKVQAEMQRRASLLNPVYFFTGKIRCETCGNMYTRKMQMQRGHLYTHWICRSKKEKGVTCKSVNFRESDLIQICTDTIGEDYENLIREMCVAESGDIHFTLLGGETKVWMRPPKPMRIPKPKSSNPRPAHLFDGMIFCGICGRRFGRVQTQTKDGGHLAWRCRSKSGGNVNCGNVNYSDTDMHDIFCKVFDIPVFDDEFFKDVISKIIIQKSGTIDFITVDGETKIYQTLKLRDNWHEPSNTDAFVGKIRCAHCRNTYSRYTTHGKYTYWYCTGKKHVRTECSAVDISDCNLRKISAYLLHTDDFSESTFTESVDYISALRDGSLEYHLKNGRVIIWQKV